MVKDGTTPITWKRHKRAQKDVDAKLTKKHGKNHLGYKSHASVDKRRKLIRKIAVAHAAVTNTTVFEALLDPNNTNRDVYADRGYPSIERESTLEQADWRVHLQRRGHATNGGSGTQKRHNRRISTPRARVEHVFGTFTQMGGKLGESGNWPIKFMSALSKPKNPEIRCESAMSATHGEKIE